MKISCTQEKLNKGLSIVSRVVGARTTLPVLSNIFLEARAGELKLSATDLEIGVSTTIGAKIDAEGAITAPARLISEFIATNDDESITLESKDTTLHLKSDRYEANIHGIDPAEFPVIPDIAKDSLIEIKSDEFIKAASKVIIACATDDTRPVLAGVFFKFVKNQLFLVATDSYRLAEKTIDVPGAEAEKEFIVPSRAMQEVLRIAASGEGAGKIRLTATENQASFAVGDTHIISRLIEGAFPNYKQIIPTSLQTSACIDLPEMISGVKMAALFARQAANNIKIKFLPKELVITSVAAEIGDNLSHIAAEVSGEEVEIAFNAKYILDILQVLPEKKVLFEVNDKASPGVIKPEKAKDYIYIIMPLRVEE